MICHPKLFIGYRCVKFYSYFCDCHWCQCKQFVKDERLWAGLDVNGLPAGLMNRIGCNSSGMMIELVGRLVESTLSYDWNQPLTALWNEANQGHKRKRIKQGPCCGPPSWLLITTAGWHGDVTAGSGHIVSLVLGSAYSNVLLQALVISFPSIESLFRLFTSQYESLRGFLWVRRHSIAIR